MEAASRVVVLKPCAEAGADLQGLWKAENLMAISEVITKDGCVDFGSRLAELSACGQALGLCMGYGICGRRVKGFLLGSSCLGIEAAGHGIDFEKDGAAIVCRVKPDDVGFVQKYFEVEVQQEEVSPASAGKSQPEQWVRRGVIVDCTNPRWFANRRAAMEYVKPFLRLGVRGLLALLGCGFHNGGWNWYP